MGVYEMTSVCKHDIYYAVFGEFSEQHGLIIAVACDTLGHKEIQQGTR